MSRVPPPPPPPPPLFPGTSSGGQSFESVTGTKESSNVNEFIPFLLLLSPHEAYVVGIILAFILSLELEPEQQVIIGYFFELLGFNLGYIAEHRLYQLEREARAKEEEARREFERVQEAHNLEREKMQEDIEELKHQLANLQHIIQLSQ